MERGSDWGRGYIAVADLDFGLWGSVFAVPKRLVDKHLRLCSYTQLRVLLMALRDGSSNVDVEDISKRLSISKDDVIDSIEYWKTTDIFASTPNPPQTVALENTAKTNQKQRGRSALTKRDAADIIEATPELREMLQELELFAGKPLVFATQQEPILYMCHSEGLTPATVLLAAQFCKENNRASIKELKKELSEWLSEGIHTYDQAEKHIAILKQRLEHQRNVIEDFGFDANHSFNNYEKKMILSWYENMHLSRELIALAANRCRSFTGGVSFAYINKILSNWSELGIKTPEQAMDEKSIEKDRFITDDDLQFGKNIL